MKEEKLYQSTSKSLQRQSSKLIDHLLANKEEYEKDADLITLIPSIIEAQPNQQTIKMLLWLLESKNVQIRLAAAQSLLNLFEYTHFAVDDDALDDQMLSEVDFYKQNLRWIESIKSPESTTLSSATLSKEKLLHALHTDLADSMEVVIVFLSSRYGTKNMDIARQGLVSKDPEVIATSLEFIDNLLKSNKKAEMMKLVEFKLSEKEKPLDALGYKPLSLKESLLGIAKTRSLHNQIACLEFILHHPKIVTRKELDFLESSPHQEINQLLDKIAMNQD